MIRDTGAGGGRPLTRSDAGTDDGTDVRGDDVVTDSRDGPAGDPVPDPARIRTAADLAASLAAVKSVRSYSDLTTAAGDLTPTAARTASAVDDWSPEPLTRGTVSDWLSGRGRPTRSKLLTFLVVCDVPAERVPAWLDALDRVREARRAPTETETETETLGRRPLLPRLVPVLLAAVLLAAVVVGAVVLAPTGSTAGGDPPAAAPAPRPDGAPECAAPEGGAATVQPQVTSDGAQLGMTFCPVVINGGRLPITGPFELSGQVVGPVGERRQVVLLNYGDPRTCDALGNAPARGGFVIHQAVVDSSDGRWSYVDRLGYDEAVTIARQYEYVTASQDSVDKLKGDAAAWVSANPDHPDDYPGVLSLPPDVKILATFGVPAGVYDGAQPCKN